MISCQKKEKPIEKPVYGEYLFRLKDESFYTLTPCKMIPQKKYPWQERFSGKYPKITKEFFRCKGSYLNPVRTLNRDGRDALYFKDCWGRTSHGLPLRDEKEFIYPCLIEILNFIQEKTQKKVIITTGHRCPTHNAYCDSSSSNWGSKHMLGAEVDFYVEGAEQEPEKILALIMEYYRLHPLFQGKKEFEKFERFEKESIGVSTPPWYNKEIFVKLFKAHEGRDFDNSHPYPYLSIQLKYDRDKEQRFLFDEKMTQNFRRY